MFTIGSQASESTMQLEFHVEDGQKYDCSVPDPDVEVMPDVSWGEVDRLFTPAFWRFACITSGSLSHDPGYRLGRSLLEEITACLLGGHGVKGEMGVAAFEHLRRKHVMDGRDVTCDEIELILSEPIAFGGRSMHYRYPRLKAKYIAAAIEFLQRNPPPTESTKDLRDWLTSIPGIGLKTASWITRNWMDASDIAILDIHIHRAGVIAGFYDPNEDISRNYHDMESIFVEFSDAIGIPANILDHHIWNQLRIVPRLVRQLLIEKGAGPKDRCGLPAAHNRSAPRNNDLFADA